MPERLGEAVLELTTDDRRFEAGLKRARTGAGDLDRRFAQLGRSAARLGRNLAIGLGAAGAGFSLLFNRAIETGDAIAKTADRIGLSTGALQELRFAAGLTGVDIGTLERALTALIRRQGEAIAGNKEFAKGFERVGITVEELRRLTPEQLVRRVADGLSEIESQALRVAAADRIMSEAGRVVINVFDGGAASLDRFAARARELGLVIDEPLLRNAEKAKDELSILGQVIGTNLTNALLRAAPEIQELSERFAEGIPKIINWVAAFAQVSGILDDEGDRVARQIIELKEKIAQLNAELDRRPFGRPTAGAEIDRLSALEAELAAAQARLRELVARERDAARALGEAAATAPAAAATAPAAEGLSAEASFEALRRVEEARQRLIEEGRRITEAQRSATERLADEQARLKRALEAGTIDWMTYNRALTAAKEEFDQATRASEDTATAIDNLAEDAVRAESAAVDLGFAFSSAFEDAIIEGRALSNVLRGLEQDILRILVRTAITEPLAQGIGAGLKALPGLFSGGGGATPLASAAASSGIITSFQRGGIVGDPQLIMAHEREAVFTPRQMDNANALLSALAGRASSTQEVNIIDRRGSGAAPEVRRGRGPDGRQVVEVIIRDAVGRAFDRGDLDRALATNFGIRRDRSVR